MFAHVAACSCQQWRHPCAPWRAVRRVGSNLGGQLSRGLSFTWGRLRVGPAWLLRARGSRQRAGAGSFFVTDPVNSRKLFLGVHGGVTWISTMHAFHLHPCSSKPDPAGLAHCLVNGVPLDGLTPFEGVRVLDRASIHEIRRTGAQIRQSTGTTIRNRRTAQLPIPSRAT